MNILRLRFAKGERDDLVLGAGVHAVGQDEEGRPCLVEDAHDARLQVSVDRRGIWLQLREHAQSMHVNGRPVRRMAMLRPGDTLHMDGVDLVLVGARPGVVPSRHEPDPPKARAVLRALGGTHHGRCFDVDRPCSVGSQADAGVHIAQPGMPAEHSVLEPHADGVSIRTVDPAATIEVNGHRLTEGLLLAGDQVVFNTSHRFVLEAPRVPTGPAQPLPEVLVAPPVTPTPRRSPLVHSLRRIPWLLLAALLMAGALALLLLYGAR